MQHALQAARAYAGMTLLEFADFVTRILVAGAIGLVSTVWFSIGGTLDLRRLFKRLAEKQDNFLDDGRVTDSDSAPSEKSAQKD